MALDAIKKASKVVMDIYHGDFTINIKNDNSEVTNADIASEKLIREELHKHFPTYAILSEETTDDLTRIENDYCWIVDPIDGTKDFVNKTNNFAINIALSYKNEIVLGVISVPCRNIIYYACEDTDAFKIENGFINKIHVSNRTSNLIMVTSQFFFKNGNEYKDNPLIEKMIAIGSSYKAGLIAEGKADLCIKDDPHTKEWDTAPSEIIVSKAGGFMKDVYGNHRTYNKKDVYNHTGFIITNCKEVLDIFKKKN